MFLKLIDSSGEVKDRFFFVVNQMREVIMYIGHQNVVQVITDNAANCKVAGHLSEVQFLHIHWIPCVIHTLNRMFVLQKLSRTTH